MPLFCFFVKTLIKKEFTHEEIQSIEIFRFIGAISVIIFHTARNTDFYNKIPILFQNGSIWVYFFFVLSGFMLTYSYSDKEVNIKKF